MAPAADCQVRVVLPGAKESAVGAPRVVGGGVAAGGDPQAPAVALIQLTCGSVDSTAEMTALLLVVTLITAIPVLASKLDIWPPACWITVFAWSLVVVGLKTTNNWVVVGVVAAGGVVVAGVLATGGCVVTTVGVVVVTV